MPLRIVLPFVPFVPFVPLAPFVPFVPACARVFHAGEPAGELFRFRRVRLRKELPAYDSDARAVLDHLKSRPDCTGKLGTMGICIGGHLAFRASMNPDVLAGACFYATDIHKRGLGKGTPSSRPATG